MFPPLLLGFGFIIPLGYLKGFFLILNEPLEPLAFMIDFFVVVGCYVPCYHHVQSLSIGIFKVPFLKSFASIGALSPIKVQRASPGHRSGPPLRGALPGRCLVAMLEVHLQKARPHWGHTIAYWPWGVTFHSCKTSQSLSKKTFFSPLGWGMRRAKQWFD